MSGYDGHVEPGGHPISRMVTLPDSTAVEVRKFSVGPMDNNAYLLTDTGTGAALLIDAANDAERILHQIGELHLVGILTTHGHPDHWQALAAVADATGAPTYLHPADAEMVPRAAEESLADGGRIRFGAAEVEVIHTPGHTPGSTCVLLGGAHLFSGDTLFPGGPGATRGDSEAFAQIMRSLRRRLFLLGDATHVYPGHGDDTTLGRERPFLDEWQQRGY